MLVAREQRRAGTCSSLGPLLAMRGRPAGLCYAMIPTAWGQSAVVWRNREDDTGDFAARPQALLSRILLPGMTAADLRQLVLARCPSCDEVLGDERGDFHPEIVPEWLPGLVEYLQAYFTTGLCDWTRRQFVDHWTRWRGRLDWAGVSAFQRQVLEEVACIPHGAQRTYGQIAVLVGKRSAARAVGAALRTNPWPILVPCHRVVGQGGRMTGFTAPGGVETKRRMLAMEGGAAA